MNAGDGALRPACPVMHRSGTAAVRQQDYDSITVILQTVATLSLQILRRTAVAAQVHSDESIGCVAILHTSSVTSYVHHSAAFTSCRVLLERVKEVHLEASSGRLIQLSENADF